MTSTSFEVREEHGSGLGNRFGVFVRPGVGPFKLVVAALCFFVGVKAFAEPLSLPGVHQSQQNIEIVLSDGITQRVGVFSLGLERIENPVAKNIEFIDLLVVPAELVTDQTTNDDDKGASDYGGRVAAKQVGEGHSKFLSFVVCLLVYAAFHLPFLLVGLWFGQVMSRRATYYRRLGIYKKYRRKLRNKSLSEKERLSVQNIVDSYRDFIKRDLRK